MATFTSVDDYISNLPADRREVTEQVRATIQSAIPGATETISYQMPTFELAGRRVVHFAAWKKHLALYPIPSGDEELTNALEPYAGDKGTLRFPYDLPIPYDLIARVVRQLALES